MPGVFAVGDATNQGASIAIEAIGEARRCAKVVDLYLNGVQVPYQKTYLSVKKVSPEYFADYIKLPRAKMPRGAEARLSGDQSRLLRGPGPGGSGPLSGLRLP